MRAAVQKKSRGGPSHYKSSFAVPKPPKDESDSGLSGLSLEAQTSSSGSSTSAERPVSPVKDDLTSQDLSKDSNAHYASHEGFLRDQIVCTAYRLAITKNIHLMRGKVVLNIGCGLGTLALFAASAGAAHVYAVESSSIIAYARHIVETNKMGHLITLIQGNVEEIQLPVPQVDVIICDWIGPVVFFNNRISAVIFARDKWLRPNGTILPDKVDIFIEAAETRGYRDWRIDWWNCVYEFNMSALRNAALSEPAVECVDHRDVVSSSWPLLKIDMYTIPAGTEFVMPFRLVAQQDAYIHAMIVYFNVSFSKCNDNVGFSTSPLRPPTKYRQTSFHLKRDLVVREGETFTGVLKVKEVKHNEAHFDLQIDSDVLEMGPYHELNEFVLNHHRI